MKFKDTIYLTFAPIITAWCAVQAVRLVSFGGLAHIAAAARFMCIGLLAVSAAVLMVGISRLNTGKNLEQNEKMVGISIKVSLFLVYCWCVGLLAPFVVSCIAHPYELRGYLALGARVAISIFMIAVSHRVYHFIVSYIQEKYFIA